MTISNNTTPKYTFGNVPSALVLEELVDKSPRKRRRVSTTLSAHTVLLRTVGNSIKDRDMCKNILSVMHRHYMSCVDSQIKLDLKTKSYLKNVMSLRYRKCLATL